MNLANVQPVVDAVLYEGYILYPYRPTSAKNRQRWTFGGIYPRVYFDATGGAEPCHMQTQCLLEGDVDTRLEVRVRFLQPVAREVGALSEPVQILPRDKVPEFRRVSSLTVGEAQFHSWQEARERDVVVAQCPLHDLLGKGKSVRFDFGGQHEWEPIRNGDGPIEGILLHSQAEVKGNIDLRAQALTEGIFRLTVRIENLTQMDMSGAAGRDQASLYSFASTHTILGVENGAFISLMDPPKALKSAALACDNQGAYPVLVGQPGSRDTLLSSPIILYDYPEIAPESPGDLYDATEIDEILSLRILAMTDAEKREMTATDPRAAALLARTEALDADDFMRLHGTLREVSALPVDGDTTAREAEPLSPLLACSGNGGPALKVGDHVRLRPKAGGDAMDFMLDGMSAVIEAIESDFEARVHVAVAIDDDPGRQWGLERMPGHRFFFSPDEIESLEERHTREARP